MTKEEARSKALKQIDAVLSSMGKPSSRQEGDGVIEALLLHAATAHFANHDIPYRGYSIGEAAASMGDVLDGYGHAD